MKKVYKCVMDFIEGDKGKYLQDNHIYFSYNKELSRAGDYWYLTGNPLNKDFYIEIIFDLPNKILFRIKKEFDKEIIPLYYDKVIPSNNVNKDVKKVNKALDKLFHYVKYNILDNDEAFERSVSLAKNLFKDLKGYSETFLTDNDHSYIKSVNNGTITLRLDIKKDYRHISLSGLVDEDHSYMLFAEDYFSSSNKFKDFDTDLKRVFKHLKDPTQLNKFMDSYREWIKVQNDFRDNF